MHGSADKSMKSTKSSAPHIITVLVKKGPKLYSLKNLQPFTTGTSKYRKEREPGVKIFFDLKVDVLLRCSVSCLIIKIVSVLKEGLKADLFYLFLFQLNFTQCCISLTHFGWMESERNCYYFVVQSKCYIILQLIKHRGPKAISTPLIFFNKDWNWLWCRFCIFIHFGLLHHLVSNAIKQSLLKLHLQTFKWNSLTFLLPLYYNLQVHTCLHKQQQKSLNFKDIWNRNCDSLQLIILKVVILILR